MRLYFGLLILFCFLGCNLEHKKHNSDINRNNKRTQNKEIYFAYDQDTTEIQKRLEMIAITDTCLYATINEIIRKKEKDCKSTYRYIEIHGDLIIMSEYFINFIMEFEDFNKYLVIINDQIIIVQAKKLDEKSFKRLGITAIVKYYPIQEYEIGNFYEFSYWYIKNGKIIKEVINNPCKN